MLLVIILSVSSVRLLWVSAQYESISKDYLRSTSDNLLLNWTEQSCSCSLDNFLRVFKLLLSTLNETFVFYCISEVKIVFLEPI